ncbi:hypothetical protein GY45DRAFT_662970 [Cubamyces sp. BRFM 1775]|nr:hypothetical protein GY45DRAFT_662970 [Cubamyces sp. BRFM 1775]
MSRNGAAVLLLLISLLNLSYVVYRVRSPAADNIQPERRVYTYLGHDHPAYLPLDGMDDLPLSPLTVEESEMYPLLGPESDAQWSSLSSASGGYVRLGPMDRLFLVAMFHELHCLRILNFAFGKAKIASRAHIQHCLNYLRLGALCASDLTLEPGDFEQRDYTQERKGATHTCRDWSLVYTLLDDNYSAWQNRTTWSP